MAQKSLRFRRSAFVERIFGSDPEDTEHISTARFGRKVISTRLRWNDRIDTAHRVSGSVTRHGTIRSTYQTKLTVSYCKPIAVVELPRLPDEWFPVDPDTIDAVEILDGHSLGIHDKFGVTTRYEGIIKDNLTIRASADDEAPWRKPDFVLAYV